MIRCIPCTFYPFSVSPLISLFTVVPRFSVFFLLNQQIRFLLIVQDLLDLLFLDCCSYVPGGWFSYVPLCAILFFSHSLLTTSTPTCRLGLREQKISRKLICILVRNVNDIFPDFFLFSFFLFFCFLLRISLQSPHSLMNFYLLLSTSDKENEKKVVCNTTATIKIL